MADKIEMAVRIDAKGRVTLPKKIRKALRVEMGDTVFLEYEPKGNLVRLARALSPFDVSTKCTTKEHQNEAHMTNPKT